MKIEDLIVSAESVKTGKDLQGMYVAANRVEQHIRMKNMIVIVQLDY